MKRRVLIVDDQESILYFLRRTLEAEDFEVDTARTHVEAMEAIAQAPDAVLLDLKLPDGSGLDLLERLRREQPGLCVVMMTAFGDVESSVAAMKRGAFDFLTKPIRLEELLEVLERALASQRLRQEARAAQRENDLFRSSPDLVPSRSPGMQEIYDLIRRVGISGSSTVLLQGESGVGKDVIANLIHRNSPRQDHAFLEINCASLPEELLESELFGHEKGAFTDAVSQKVGLLELAHKGTLFLDEIGEMSVTIQVKLLRVLEKMSFRRVGGIKDIQVDVRILCATNRELRSLVAQGRFREDLYYRLNVIPLTIPPLRERPEDILPLAQHFLARFSERFGKGFTGISEEARARLLAHPWPGNIRELRNVMERVALLEDARELGVEHLPFQGESEGREQDLVQQIEQAIRDSIPPEGLEFEALVSTLERSLIEKAYRAAGGNQSQTAKLLNLNRDKLRYRMKSFQLL